MQGIFHTGGWGMYPTTVAGALLVFSAMLFARQPERKRLYLVCALGMLTLLVATLGFVSGVIRSTTATGGMLPSDASGAVIIGFGESLVNIGYGLAMLVMATIGVCIGIVRDRGRRAPASTNLVDPLNG